ncbi:MAG TPA: hypothetical protein VJI52_04995 [Candidatus Nanoarchaeia archaeon]|nr:hypothetical protein [Candidatus Nanoarchaeia archaeon]
MGSAKDVQIVTDSFMVGNVHIIASGRVRLTDKLADFDVRAATPATMTDELKDRIAVALMSKLGDYHLEINYK